MRTAAAILLLIACLAVPAQSQEAPPEGMSAIRLAEMLASSSQARRDRAAAELELMSADTARALGQELLRLGVREAQAGLAAAGRADCKNAAITACVALDSRRSEVRAAALDALIAMHPSNTGLHCDKLLRDRVHALRKLILEEDYLTLLADGLQSDEQGIEKPIEPAMCLTILLDRHLGTDALPLLMNGFAAIMLGENEGDKLSALRRYLGERRRRGAAAWCEALWVADPAVQFNYSPTAPWRDRKAAVARISAKLTEMQERELTLSGRKYTGLRYGDYLIELYGSDVSETRAAAYLRTQWWRGDEVIIAGEGYADAVDTFNAMNNRELARVRRDLYRWWHDYRKTTEIN